MANVAAGLFVIAALGGVFLNLAYQQKGLPVPKNIVVVHALLAVAGFILLLMATYL